MADLCSAEVIVKIDTTRSPSFFRAEFKSSDYNADVINGERLKVSCATRVYAFATYVRCKMVV